MQIRNAAFPQHLALVPLLSPLPPVSLLHLVRLLVLPLLLALCLRLVRLLALLALLPLPVRRRPLERQSHLAHTRLELLLPLPLLLRRISLMPTLVTMRTTEHPLSTPGKRLLLLATRPSPTRPPLATS